MNLISLGEVRHLLGDHVVVTGTGHRPQDIAAYDTLGFIALVEVAKDMIVSSGAAAVIAGGALGWDTALATAALELELPLVLALPFPGQEKRWQKADQQRYRQQQETASAVVYLTEETPGDDMDAVMIAMNARNAFMVDHSRQVLAFWSGKARGGTANCVSYAKRVRKPVVNGWTPAWGTTPPSKLLSTVSVQLNVDAHGYRVALQQDRTAHNKQLRQTVLYRAASGPSGVQRDWTPKQGRLTGPSNPGRLFLTGLLRAVNTIKKADYVRFNLTSVQLAQVQALRVDAARGYFDRQPDASSFVGSRVVHALLKENVVKALGRFPHNLGEFGVRSTQSISGFQGEHRFLSNFWACPVLLDGRSYRSVEAAYQAAKTLNLNDRTPFQTAQAASAKHLGRNIKVRSDWDEIKTEVMRGLLTQKFALRTALAASLKATGHRPLVEANTWGDTFWGVCNHEGQNRLGKMLMDIRSTL